MTKVLDEATIDPHAEAVALMLAEVPDKDHPYTRVPSGQSLDLSDGGMVDGVRVTPRSGWGGEPLEKGRPAARRAWSWNGTESLLPLAYNPQGTRDDGAIPYLLKKHCLCCNGGGFKGTRCPACLKNRCAQCNGSSDPSKIIRNFYLNKDDVPFPERFYGPIDCFLSLCIRRGGRGFKTEEDMRLHATTCHKMEYRAHLESQAAAREDELSLLRKQVAGLMRRTKSRAKKAKKVVPSAS